MSKLWWLLLLGLVACSRPAANPYDYQYVQASGPTTDELITFYRDRVERNPKGFVDRATLAEAYLEKARLTRDPSFFELAAQLARESIERQPNPGATLVLAQVHEATHEFAQCVALCEDVLHRDSNNEGALSLLTTANIELGRVDQAEAWFKRLPREPGPGYLGLKGRLAEARGQFEQAAEYYQEAINLEQPQQRSLSALLRVEMGRCLMRLERFEAARQAFLGALQARQDDPAALLWLGHLAREQMDYSRAGEFYTRAFAKNQEAAPLVWLGLCHHLAGRDQEAERVWEQAQTILEGDLARGHYGHGRDLGRLYLERGRPEDVARAVEVMKNELERRRDNETLTVAARAFAAAGQPAKAAELVKEARRWGYDSPELEAIVTPAG
ncbi:MAG: tetratricopeptide repeat protein [Vulcanimicrobiota bacterium]